MPMSLDFSHYTTVIGSVIFRVTSLKIDPIKFGVVISGSSFFYTGPYFRQIESEMIGNVLETESFCLV